MIKSWAKVPLSLSILRSYLQFFTLFIGMFRLYADKVYDVPDLELKCLWCKLVDLLSLHQRSIVTDSKWSKGSIDFGFSIDVLSLSDLWIIYWN